ncbi:MAG: hypothetical protein KKD73_01435 [Proteobacteria bacterium]|nr:hypothetical protein [Pseudomonadota bacterium]MBU1641525.1 hypothetical protein [Pseudomonadota bacterium]
MTFHCKNYDINADACKKLKGDCLPGRKGCVLEGRFALSEELEQKIHDLEEKMKRAKE